MFSQPSSGMERKSIRVGIAEYAPEMDSEEKLDIFALSARFHYIKDNAF
jgi:hypothetical protein